MSTSRNRPHLLAAGLAMTSSLHQRVPAATHEAYGTGQPGGRGRRTVAATAVVTACVGLAVLVGLDGSVAWRIVRVGLVVAAGCAAIATRSGPRGLRAATALLLGIPAFVAGAGIGVPHAAEGLWVTGAAGLLSLASGVVLLLGAASGFWGTTGRWGRAGIVLAALVIGQWVLFPMSSAVFATNRAPTPLPDRTPSDVGLEYRDITMTTRDGVTLSAWYVPSTNGAALVFLHGSGSTRADIIDHAAALSASGYGALLLDARGHGESGGNAMDFGWHGDADIAAAVDFLMAAPDVSGQIGAVGLSMGGEEAIGAAAAIPELSAVVAEGVTGRRGADWLPLRPAGVGRWFSTGFYVVQDATTELLSGAGPPMDLRSAIVAAAPRPMLVIAGDEVPQEGVAGRRLQEAAPDRVALWEVPEAAHTGGLATDPEGWTRKVVAFLDRALLDTDGGE